MHIQRKKKPYTIIKLKLMPCILKCLRSIPKTATYFEMSQKIMRQTDECVDRMARWKFMS